jgi:succinate dehydrogenase/fumarate reductase flavoprotein subunit
MVRLSYPNRYVATHPTLGITQAEYDLIAAYYDNGRRVMETLMASTALKPMEWTTWDGQAYPDYFAQLPENKVQRGRSLVVDVNGHPERMIWPGGGGTGESLLWQLQSNFAQSKIQVLLEHHVLDVIRNDAGAICGLTVDRGDDQPVSFRAKRAVVFCSGGFTHNVELCRAHLKGAIWGGCAAPGSTGDFIPIAESAGAVLGNMANAWWGQIAVEPALKVRSVAADVWSTPGDSMIQVNRYGRRFVNEKIQYNERTQVHFTWDPVHAEYPNLLSFMIWDSRTAQHYAGYDPIPAAETKSAHVIEGATLAELTTAVSQRLASIADKTGGVTLDAGFQKNLEAAIKRFNGFAKKGKDEDFARGEAPIEHAFQFMNAKQPANPFPAITMHPIADHGPYYCVILGAGTLDTKGGPVVNAKGQVLDAKREAIPGLYAAGNCVSHPAGQAYWAGGGTIGPAMTFGYLAGSAAATEEEKAA